MASPVSLSPKESRSLHLRGLQTILIICTLMGLALFFSAGTLNWPAAWIFLVYYAIQFGAWMLWGIRNNPDLMRERAQSLGSARNSWDKIFIPLNLVLSLGVLVVAGLDMGRYGWSEMSLTVQIIGSFFVLAGYGISLSALMSNPFASGVMRIQEERGHKVISKGPYQVVRHPMYSGNILSNTCLPLLLGSYWALIPGFLQVLLLLYRTWREDGALQENLPGYKEYVSKVGNRLIPGIW